jgi:phosphate-selective porin
VGKAENGFFQPGLLLQVWLDAPNYSSRFRARRAELRVKGEIVPELIAYNIMIDPAKLLTFTDATVPVDNQTPAPAPGTAPETVSIQQPPNDTSILQDAYVTAMSEYVDVSFGQFKNLISWEGYNSSSKIIMPERALVSRTYGDRRDLGIKAEKKFDRVMYAVGLLGGQGPNQPDTNNQKNAVVRAELYPIDGALIGGLAYIAVGERDAPGTDDRAEADLRLELANVLFQAEYIRGWDMNSDGTERTEGHGAYGAVGYTFVDRIQPVVRIGFLDPDLETSQDYTIGYELGVNYFVQQHEMKLQLSYSLFDNAQNYQDSEGDNLTEVILNAQVSF